MALNRKVTRPGVVQVVNEARKYGLITFNDNHGGFVIFKVSGLKAVRPNDQVQVELQNVNTDDVKVNNIEVESMLAFNEVSSKIFSTLSRLRRSNRVMEKQYAESSVYIPLNFEDSELYVDFFDTIRVGKSSNFISEASALLLGKFSRYGNNEQLDYFVNRENLNSDLLNYDKLWSEKGEVLFADKDSFDRWMNKPNHMLDDEKPIDLINAEEGFEEVNDVLGRMQHGVMA